jgi:L-asparagine oxygenase
VEDAFTDLRPDFVALLCLRGDVNAVTGVASIRHIDLSSEVAKVLSEPRFMFTLDDSHSLGDIRMGEGPLPVLFGARSAPFVRLDPSNMSPTDPVAAEALGVVMAQLESACRRITLAAGDLLVMNNHLVVHGRTRYLPRYDGYDRWLQRVVLVASRRQAVTLSGSYDRVIDLRAAVV